MRTYFSGLILPERAPLSLATVRSKIHDREGREVASIGLNIYANQITAAVDSVDAELYTLRNFVRAEAEFLTGLVGFVAGHGYDVVITKAFGEDLDPTLVFGIDIPVLTERARGRDLQRLVNAVAPLCYGEQAIFLQRCLVDLSSAMKRLDDSAFYCYRAIESIRRSFGPELSDREQWQAMSTALGSSRDEMEPLRARAFDARHGQAAALSDQERSEVFTCTWDVVEKYIDFRLDQGGLPRQFSQE